MFKKRSVTSTAWFNNPPGLFLTSRINFVIPFCLRIYLVLCLILQLYCLPIQYFAKTISRYLNKFKYMSDANIKECMGQKFWVYQMKVPPPPPTEDE